MAATSSFPSLEELRVVSFNVWDSKFQYELRYTLEWMSMTLNTHLDLLIVSIRYREIVKEFERHKADIVCLQEVTERFVAELHRTSFIVENYSMLDESGVVYEFQSHSDTEARYYFSRSR